MTPQKISIIGCGRVGTALSVFLSKAGYHIAAVASRTRSSAEKTVWAAGACGAVGAVKIYESPAKAAMAGDIIFITTQDHLIEKICSDISTSTVALSSSPETAVGISVDISSKTIFHCSGALSSCVLSSASDKGANTGSIHPLQSFAPYDPEQKSPFAGINVSVEGNEKAVIIGKELIHALGANYFTIPTKAKTLYHAAAVVASNYLVTLEHFAFELLKEASLSEQKAYEILDPLIQGTLSNIKTRGAVAALTGPIARGDAQIVEKHLSNINERLPEFSKLYRVMGKYTLELAAKRGELDKVSVERLTDILTE
ncbi:MAG: DUF2520 domain-containing protein [Desulfamplus sp.]|nr:DUF2520 domain-containing protein [Desulfamplus sp.]